MLSRYCFIPGLSLYPSRRALPRIDTMDAISYADFEKVDVRVGRIIRVETFPEARKPAYRLTIDFGEDVGVKRSSAQLTQRYKPQDLEGRLVLGVVNLGARQ